MESYLWTIFLVTLAGGFLGGVINFYLLDDESRNQDNNSFGTEKSGWLFKLFKSIVIGIGAAFVVPLFLQTISSSIMNDCRDESQLFFVYAGFCILASIFSRRFLDSVAEKALKTAQKANEKSTTALNKAEELEPLQVKATETDEDLKEEISKSDMLYLESDAREKLRLDIPNVRKAFKNSKYAYRTSKGIAKDIKLEEGVVILILEEMEKAGHAKRIINKENNKTLWSLTK